MMDGDLWGPSYTQDSPENSFGIQQNEWECDFYFGYGADVIEEDALNEKSCVEVLRKLISKADIEIEALEEDLVILQTQLEWAEQNKLKEWFEICCNGLEEKTNFLDLLIRNLKNENVQNECDNDIQSLMHGEPPGRISEMLKALLRTHCQSKSEQTEDIASKYAFSHGTGESSDRESLSNFESGSSITDEIVELSVTHADISLDSSIIAKDFRSDALSHAMRKFDDEESLSSLCLKNITIEEVKESNFPCAKDFRSDALSHAMRKFDDEESLSSLSLKNITIEEVKESNFPCINVSLNSSVKPDGKSMNHPVTVTAQEAGILGTDNALAESPSALLGNEESNVPFINIGLNLSMKPDGKSMNYPVTVTAQEAGILGTDNAIAESPSDLLGNVAKDIIMSDTMAVQESRISATDSTVNGNSHLKLQGQMTKNEMQFHTVDGHEPCVPPIADVISITSSNSRGKERQKPGSTCRNNSANNQKTTKKTVHPIPCGLQEPGVESNDSETSLHPPSKAQVKKRKIIKRSDIAEVKEPSETPTAFSPLQGVTIVSTSKEDLQLSNSCEGQGPGVVDDNSHDELLLPSKPPIMRKKSTKTSDVAKVKETSETVQGDTVKITSKEDLHLSNSSVVQEPRIVGSLCPRSELQVKRIMSSNQPSRVSNEPSVAVGNSTLQGDSVNSTNKEKLQISNSSVAQETRIVGDNNHNSLCLPSEPQAERSMGTDQASRDSNEPSVALGKSTLQGDTIEMNSEKGLEFCKSSVCQESCVAPDHNHSANKPSGKKRKREGQLSKSCGLLESHEVIGSLPTDRGAIMKLTMNVLRAHVKQRGLKGLSTKKKSDIVDRLLQGPVEEKGEGPTEVLPKQVDKVLAESKDVMPPELAQETST
ncbi:uncharacterized protein LOC122062090 [Macadamia integrifolia]|uniref:uncharacterized protein LOC122062090 n=1 Tax=Macadamia integrifolia TaxID=60698 RepID=UPI001C52D88B|nr:uncharacterized protein LOC122062090 [Macadamia integrifolia]